MADITGGCRCGAVRFRFSAPPLMTRVCWCRDCQYWASGNGTVNAVFRTDSLAEVTGVTTEFVSRADSGNTMSRRFCPSCGTPLFSQGSARPDIMVVRVGALDDPEAARPSGTIWAASAPSWGHVDRDLPVTDGQPPAPPPL